MDDPLFALSDEAVLARFLPALKQINPRFDPSWVRAAHVFKAGYAQPIMTPDYAEHIPPFDTPVPGLYVGNMFQVYPQDRGQNYSIRLGDRLARHVLAAAPVATPSPTAPASAG
jgi:protoporphyrinogen oxidase